MEYAAYTIQGDGVTLYRLYGTGPAVEVPARIDGRKVTKLADHLFADEMSVLCDSKQMLLAVQKGSEWIKLEEGQTAASRSLLGQEALCGEKVGAVYIPEGVRQIGNYAFYGLYQLKEVCFPSTLQRIGWGMFNACRMTERIVFRLTEPEDGRDTYETPAMMKEVVDSLSNEIDAVVIRGEEEWYRLRFPAYYEEGKENTPARIIEIIYHGTGHQYRNCFLNRELQFDRYDEVFPLAAAQESPMTNVHLILNRLRSGPLVNEDILKRYLNYLRQENEVMMEVILSDPEFDPALTLRMLDHRNLFTRACLDQSIRIASEKKIPSAVSCLMDIRARRFPQEMDSKRRSRYAL